MKKQGLTFEEHDELGLELQTIYDRMVIVKKNFSTKHYPEKNGGKHAATVKRELKQMVASLSNLKGSLEELLFLDCPDKDSETLQKIYFRALREDHVRSPQPIRPVF
ncbi:MAG: hypothetical protein HQK65_07545 [Desulfamplus sp.]|nr:hypothetical protein [Desulfamplus sp.]